MSCLIEELPNPDRNEISTKKDEKFCIAKSWYIYLRKTKSTDLTEMYAFLTRLKVVLKNNNINLLPDFQYIIIIFKDLQRYSCLCK